MSAGDDTTPPAKPYGGQPCPCMRGGFWPLTLRECLIHGDAAAAPRAGDTAPDRDEPMASNPLDLDTARHIALAPGGYSRAQVALAADRVVSELDRLRSDAAALERQRDHLQGQLDIIHDAEYTRNDTLRRENARLRALSVGDVMTVLQSLVEELDAFRRQPLADGDDPTRAAGAAAAISMVQARIRTALHAAGGENRG